MERINRIPEKKVSSLFALIVLVLEDSGARLKILRENYFEPKFIASNLLLKDECKVRYLMTQKVSPIYSPWYDLGMQEK